MYGEQNASRSGLTLMELLIVISVMVLLGAMGMAGVFPRIRESQVMSASEMIINTSREARQLAQTRTPKTNSGEKGYGTIVVGGQPGQAAWVALTYGEQANITNILQDKQGQPVVKSELPRGLQVWVDTDRDGTDNPRLLNAGEAVGWMHQYGTGNTIVGVQDGIEDFSMFQRRSIAVGVTDSQPPGLSPVTTHLSVRTPDGQHKNRILIHPIGLGSSMEIE